MTITTVTAAAAEKYKAYSQSLLCVDNATQPYIWTLDSGTLPPGILLTDNGVDGTLSGTPTTPALYSFTVRVTDSTGGTPHTDTQDLTLLVTELYFPSPTRSGIYWRHFKQNDIKYEDITDVITYEDEGKDFNERTDTPPIIFDIDYTGLTTAQRQVFDDFNDDAKRSRTFSLIDKFGVTWTGLRIVSYEGSHEDHKSWVHAAVFRLCKYAGD